MSINNQELRTLSGLTTIKADQVELPSSRRAIAINGQYGVAGDVLQKSSDNKLSWGKVDDIEIPDGSIEGSKLAPDIDITTTGDISATDITATNYFNQTNASASNTFAGELIVPKLETTNQEVEAIRVRNGGVVNIMAEDGGSPDPGTQIQLSGINGKIICKDINITAHTGTADFNAIDCNSLSIPLGIAKTMILNTDGIQLSGNKPNGFSGAGAGIECSNITMKGTHSSLSCLCEGNLQIVSSSGDTPQGGDLTLSSGDLLLTSGGATINAGDFTLSSATSSATFKGEIDVYGNSVLRGGCDFIGDNAIDFIDSGSNLNMRISPDTGNITNPVGKLTMSKAGTTPAPTDSSSYTDWAIDVSDTDGHMRVEGNIICNGKIFGDVEGAITEEEVDCQRLTLRTATPPLSGITGMIMGAGSIISNDTTGLLELTIDADTSGMVINNIAVMNNTASEQAFQVVGNCSLSSGSGRTTTIGNVGDSGQTLEVLCNNVNLGETAGNQQNNTLNYRGGVHTFTGERVDIGDRLGFTNIGCSLEGSAGIGTDNIYKNHIKYFHLEGQHISHTLAGTFLYYRILRSASAKQIPITYSSGFNNSSTSFTNVTNFNFVDINCETSVAKIEVDLFYRHYKGAPDLQCRIDHTLAGAAAYPSQTGGPTLLINAASANTGTEIRVTHSFYITGLIPNTDADFYPKFAQTASSSAKGSLMYGGNFADMSMNISFVEAYNGTSTDPYSTPGDLATATTQEEISHIGNISPYEFINVYDPSSQDLDSLSTSYTSLLFTNVAETFTAERSTIFIEILSFVYSSSSNKTSYIRLADNGGNEWSVGTNQGGDGTGTRSTERIISVADETDRQPFTINYKLVGLTIGDTYTIQPQMKTSGIYNYVVAGGSYPATIVRAYYPPYDIADVDGTNEAPEPEPEGGDDY